MFPEVLTWQQSNQHIGTIWRNWIQILGTRPGNWTGKKEPELT
ncbi:hypothetical protein LEP1GSC137_2214 [Leptospira borgpetersenii str. Noumea 25]|uniref:Uncharacterized protein n=1 Tax=Leptospira borgpetersenii str. Brem 328 TaxID=1049780 RepID=A0ABC9SHR4_LEPBO|nr:hypothetical protein LEP1GSC101_0217 [Leptospira borgpetersenii str. UI 09149]EKR02279.1 hypothetical protein LEP1GSC121_0750 [Leptospira borgpetersenii serovar Castellonis str. 200801910]EMN15113.1 hypothetical protein LEP1GSC055_1195 [Leptospira borgpetersenii str. Brem 307]EMN17368.1 hypothetical protein LEP1GSC056_3879 [Leptospira borgpetersenii str. Brem 328]EMO11049.1 hypothetical protein LEP1GSC137_2214 [Leptospira borgpetersenii str. Noumea 25]ENO64638.1 hypothetical protein LEP1GSC